MQRILDRPLEIERQLAAQAMEVPEDLHEPRGLGAERRRVAVDEVQAPVEEDEAVGQRLLPLAALGGASARERLLTARDETLRDAVDDPRVQVVLAHEPLDAQRLPVVLVPEVLGDLRLQFAREHVVLWAPEGVEAAPPAAGEGHGG